MSVDRQGVLGYGSGKAADTNAAVRKAYSRATRNLTYVPRFHGHTVHYPITTVMGKTKLIMIPRSSGTGVTASRVMQAICKLAGIHNVMIKIQASNRAAVAFMWLRCQVSPAVKCCVCG